MRKGIKSALLALPGIIAAIERWGARAMDLIGLPSAATQLKDWAAFLPEIGSGTYWVILFSVIGLLIVHLWPKAQPSTTIEAVKVGGVRAASESFATTPPSSFYREFCNTIDMQNLLLGKLRNLTTEHTTIKIAVASIKQLRLARTISSTFDLAGWKTNLNETPLESYRNEYCEGIEIQGFNELFVNSLCAAFRESGFQNINPKIEVSQIPKDHPTKWPWVLYSVRLTIGHE